MILLRKLNTFLNYLFRKSVEFNRENREEKGESFFPVCSFNDRSHSYDVEYVFFVKIYADYAREVYGVDETSVAKIYSYLYSSTDDKITRARYMFFVGLLGSYYRLGNGYFNDMSKNTRQIFFEKAVENSSGEVAHSRVVMIRDFVKEHIKDKAVIEELGTYKLEQVAYGLKKIKEYEEKHEIEALQKIYNLELN